MLEKKEERSGKRLIIGLSGGLIVLFGALASLFSVYYSSREAQLTRVISASLKHYKQPHDAPAS